MKSDTSVLIGMVGDLMVDREEPLSAFDSVKPIFDDTDILFGNFEVPCADDPQWASTAEATIHVTMDNLGAYDAAGFDVVSLANNHIMDAGSKAMLDCREYFNTRGVQTCGAGKNLEEARKPAFIKKDGVTTAFLAYSSVFNIGYEARNSVPGLAPMRAYNHYHEWIPNIHQPGLPPRIETIPDQDDMKNLKEDIEAAKEAADIVIVSFHWGDFTKPYHLTDHELRTARYAVDCGADIIAGHHHHLLRGMEWYKGKPIFYGLGHFLFEFREELPDHIAELVAGNADDPNYYGAARREGWPHLPLHPEARMTALAWVEVEKGNISGAGFLPCRLTTDGGVKAVCPESDEGKEIITYIERGCANHDLNGHFIAEEDIVLAGFKTVRMEPTT